MDHQAWLSIMSILSAFIVVYFKDIRATIYDLAITKMTKDWYATVLEQIPENARILDVGIGTGASLIANKDIIVRKKLTVVGVDYDADYVDRCKSLIKSNKLQSNISVYHQSFYDFGKEGASVKENKFDFIYFSGSLMIMPNPVGALNHAVNLLKNAKSGTIFTTQTFEKTENRLLEIVKPLLKFITTIDFGRVTYENDFIARVKEADLRIVEDKLITTSGISGVVSKKDRAFHCIKLQRN